MWEGERPSFWMKLRVTQNQKQSPGSLAVPELFPHCTAGAVLTQPLLPWLVSVFHWHTMTQTGKYQPSLIYVCHWPPWDLCFWQSSWYNERRTLREMPIQGNGERQSRNDCTQLIAFNLLHLAVPESVILEIL